MKKAILLVNLGTPSAPTSKAVRRYLRQFLSDPRVVEIPKIVWWFILNGIILPLRGPKSAKNYQKVWTAQGSPLLVNLQKQAEALNQLVQASMNHTRVFYAMRYGEPAIQSILERIREQQFGEIIVLPLNPQYSATTTASIFDEIARVFATWRNIPKLHFISHYYDNKHYIDALAHSIEQHWQQHGRAEKLLFSFHGIPKRCVNKGDPYEAHCKITSDLLANRLGLENSQWQLCFQSRFGAEKWLQPYTEPTVITLAQTGTRSIDIICPGFSSDCLETLEEINLGIRARFLEHGGQQFHYIPALNDQALHIEAILDVSKQNIL